MKHINIALVATIISIFSLSSCIKQTYDNPGDLSNVDPNLNVNVNIKDLSFLVLGTNNSFVLGDSIISGIVTADDRTGNFYKQIVIQDSTGGITIGIANTYLYSNYPIGRKVYIKLKNLTLVCYKGTPEIVYSLNSSGTVNGIPPTLQDSFIVKASYPHTVTPQSVRMSDLIAQGPLYINKLITIVDGEIDSSFLNQPYAKPSSVAISTSVPLDGCVGGTKTGQITLYNSGYASFFNAMLPSGYGSITGIFNVYGSTNQFMIRDTSDVRLNQTRCY